MRKTGPGCTLLAALILLPCATSAAESPDGKPFSLQQHLDWEIAICYHPMYMLVDEDRTVPTVGERIPPWGAATAEQYLERVKRNLDSLERDPKLTLNYEWAAHSLDDIANRFPDVMKRMQAAHQRGQLDFVGGEYSLVHTQTYGSESNWRQFEEGHEVFRRLFNKKITVHAHQEPQLFHQLPQVLRYFGYEYLVLPSFPWAVTISQGPFELLGHESGAYLKKGDEFIRAAALDGTTVPAYFATNVRDRSTQDNGAMAKDLWGCPPIWIDFPDLEEYHNPNGWAAPVLLGKALQERIKAAPPRAEGTLHTYYSYVEGLGAEEHLRKNKAAEEAAALAGNLLSMARLAGRPLDRQDALHSIWRTILKYQDHDATWLDAIDLRRKAIGKFEEGILLSRKLMAQAAQRLVEDDAASLSVFNALPHARKALLDLPPQHLPAGIVFQQVGQRRLGFCELPAGGFRSFPKSAADGAPSREGPLPRTIVTDGYRVDFSREGLIHQIATAAGKDLLAAGQYLGGEIRAVIDNRWASNRRAAVKFFDGDVCAVVERSGTFGGPAAADRPVPEARGTAQRAIPLRERYCFFKHQPVIKVELEFDFDGAEVGDFHIDETKINVYYPTAGSEVHHDIPFGYVQARENESLLATNWVHCGGLVYVNRGTLKHWVRDGVIANTIAWGGDAWSNRVHYGFWMARCKQSDLRLRGCQKIEYFLLPIGPFDGVKIVHAVESLIAPTFVCPGRGEKSFYALADRRLATTALFEKDGQVWARGCQLPGGPKGRWRDWEIFNVPWGNVPGAAVKENRPDDRPHQP